MSTQTDRVATAARRLQILTALALEPRYTLATFVLREKLELTGFAMSNTKLAVELAFLADLELVDTGDSTVSLTEAGRDVACGLVKLPGIATPAPGAL